MAYYETDNYYQPTEDYETTSTTVELNRTERGLTNKINKNIRVTIAYHYKMIPIKHLGYELFEFEIRKKFLCFSYWVLVGKYHNYQEGLSDCEKMVGCV